MRILNAQVLTSHGNVAGRKALLQILEAGLQAADPYNNTVKLVRVQGGRLIVGNKDFEPLGTPRPGDATFDLSQVGEIYVFGAGKGSQRVAKAIEDVLGDRLTGGHIIDKKGADIILERVGVTLGAHPVPDEDCVRGCERISSMIKSLKKEDLVFTVASNGVSSLLTMPVPGVGVEDVRRTTYLMQIERGAPTGDLNPVRNHLDMMKGGRFSARIHPARAIHIVACDPQMYDQLMHRNVWLHNLPDCTTFGDAVMMLKKWDAWDAVPASVRAHLERADPQHETIKAHDFEKTTFRIFGVMPSGVGMLPTAAKKAGDLGFEPHTLTTFLQAEASQAGSVVAAIARNIEHHGQPFEPPCALLTGGELLVTVGKESGIGGRNQEFALSAALRIAGSRNIVVGSADSDGTDGPGTQFAPGSEGVPSLDGGIVDGETVDRAKEIGIDIRRELLRHNATPALWKLDSGVVTTHNISLNDLGVTLILDRR